MPSLSDVMWSSLLFDDFIHRYKLVSLAGKEWEKEQRGERKMERQDRSDIIAAPHLLQSVAEPRVEGKYDLEGKLCSSPPTVTYVERIINHYNHLSSPYGPWNIPLLMKLYCKIAEYKCFALFRSGSCKTLSALLMTSPSSDRAGSLLPLRGFVRKHCDLKRKGGRKWKVPCSPQTAQNNPEEFIAGEFCSFTSQ